MSRVWIPGGNGMLGTAFRRHLECHEVVCTDLEVDITKSNLVLEFIRGFKPECIINCAAYTNVDGAEDEKDIAWEINVIGARNIAMAADEARCPVVHFSTDYVFGGSLSSYSETDHTSPLNHYGLTKARGEHAFCTYPRSWVKQDSFVVRTSWLFSHTHNNFVRTMLRLLREKDEVQVVSDQYGRPTYAPYLAEVVSKILFDTPTDRITGVWHITNSGTTSWYQFAVHVHEMALEIGLLHKKTSIIPIMTEQLVPPRKAQRPKCSVLETNRVEALLEQALKPWKQSLRDCLNEIKLSESNS